jgi:hypothetical protein
VVIVLDHAVHVLTVTAYVAAAVVGTDVVRRCMRVELNQQQKNGLPAACCRFMRIPCCPVRNAARPAVTTGSITRPTCYYDNSGLCFPFEIGWLHFNDAIDNEPQGAWSRRHAPIRSTWDQGRGIHLRPTTKQYSGGSQ